MATKKETAAADAVENAVETVEKAEAATEEKDDGMVTIPGTRDPQAPAEGAGSSRDEWDVPSERPFDRGRHDPAVCPG